MDRLGAAPGARHLMQNSPFSAALGRRYTGGATAEDAIDAFAELRARGFAMSLHYLGGPADTPEKSGHNFGQVMSAINALAHARRDIVVSLSLDQIGYRVSAEVGLRNVMRVGERLAEIVDNRKTRTPGEKFRDHLVLEMAGVDSVERTLELRTRLGRLGIPVAATVQANLRRSVDDVRLLISEGAPVRLVKGRYPEAEEQAWQHREDVDDAYFDLAAMLLSEDSLVDGVYPAFATHDGDLVNRLRRLMSRNGWSDADCEFEMYLGVREDFQRAVRGRGHCVRLYVPFGADWWPYAARRVGENRANLGQLFSWPRREER
jgi:proline dehydrogenase